MSVESINVTKTYLPRKEKYQSYVDEIYENGWITNNGPLKRRLEQRLARFLNVKNIVLVANGTVAMEIAYRTLDIQDYVITTPFSFVATTSSLVTNGLKPVFADIDPDTLNIDPEQIIRGITKNTRAIVPVHVFGNACDIDRIQMIAKEYDLKVIYDAAHAFNVNYRNQSILSYGNISTISFHATKLFHTIEGGALVIQDDELVKKARYLINFGIENRESIPELGTNAKMNEFEAAMGLCVLDEIEDLIQQRKTIYERYEDELTGRVDIPVQNPDSTKNYGYFPIVLKDDAQRAGVQEALARHQIFPRRYFYPSLDSLSYIEPKQYCGVSRSIATRILTLPIFPELPERDQDLILRLVKDAL